MGDTSTRRHATMVLGPVALLVFTLASAASARTASPAAVDVRTVYLRDCATCHGSNGLGTTRGPSLEGWGRAGTDYVLTSGRMPLASPDAPVRRGEPAYDDATIAALVDYVDALVPGGPDIPEVDPAKGDLAEGGSLFRAQCAACHRWSGEGGALIHREAPPLDAATPTQIGEAVRLGPGAMPVFGSSALDDHQLDSVARYVTYLDSPNDRGGLSLGHIGPVAEGAVGLAAIGLLALGLRLVGTRE